MPASRAGSRRARASATPTVLSQSKLLDSLFVPAHAVAGTVGNDGHAVDDLKWLLQEGRGPVDILQPMPARRGREQMCADLREEMRRNFPVVGGCQTRGARPPCYAADTVEVQHHVVRRARGQGSSHRRQASEVLADLDRRPRRLRYRCGMLVVVVTDRLLDPVHTFAIEL